MEINYGYGYGYGYGDGDGYGSSDGKITIPKENAWTAYHYITKHNECFVMRNGQNILLGEAIHEDNIKLCEYGLHACLDAEDAKQWKPTESILTKVKVWGDLIISKDKLVATNRMIVEVIDAR